MRPIETDPIRKYVLSRLESELAPDLSYHNLSHTRDDVVPAALRLADLAGIAGDERQILEIAALFHDVGFLNRRQGHERAGCEIARRVLPGFGLEVDQIERIAQIIMATKLPQSPQDLLGEILADADLDVLGRDDFFSRNHDLRREMEEASGPISDQDWYSQQLGFLEGHTYFTPAARALRGAGKARNLAEIFRRLESLINPPRSSP
jgi:uncharacterized protein